MKELLQTERADVFFYAANGHGGWEAVIANLVAPGASVLVPGTGHFSDGWAEQVEAFGGTAVRTPYIEGLPIDPAAVEAVLRDDTAHRIGAVFVVHTDTASGTTCDLAALRRAIDAAAHPALFVVDVVASLGASAPPVPARPQPGWPVGLILVLFGVHADSGIAAASAVLGYVLVVAFISSAFGAARRRWHTERASE